MALGGGYWLKQNKILPGAYINFVSKRKAQFDSVNRGYVTMALDLDWGKDGEIVRVEQEEFQKNTQAIFGYEYSHEKMKGLRDLFLHAKTLYFYRLNSNAVKATGTYGTAKCGGGRGNDITVSVQQDLDNTGKYVVKTFIANDGVSKLVDKQSNIAAAKDLVDNDYVTFKKDATLAVTAGDKFQNGTNGDAITSGDYQKYIELIEPYYFNTLGYVGSDNAVQELLQAFAKRCREDTGAKFQVVMYNKSKANYEGVISVLNKVKDQGAEVGSLVYWTTGAEGACEINKSLTNFKYDGEFLVDTNYKQYELEQAITDGQLVFHNVTDPAGGNVTGDVRVLEDVNSFTEFTKDKSKDFSKNQVIRVLDNMAYDVARLFNKTYLGKENADAIGYAALWADVVKLCEEYEHIRAIKDFHDKDVQMPTEGNNKGDVVLNLEINPTLAMTKLYATVTVA